MGVKIEELNDGIIIQDDDIFPLSQSKSNVNGLSGLYFNSTNFTNFIFTRIDAIVDFNWGSGSPTPLMSTDRFSVRWVGKVIPKYTETYTFYTVSDDGVRLWVNDVLIVDNWTLHGVTENSGTINLVEGVPVNIKLEFYENTGAAIIQLKWSSNSQSKEIIPNTQLATPIVNIAVDWVAYFNGSTDFITVPSDNIIDDFTIEAWIKKTSNNKGTIVHMNQGSTGGIHFWINGSNQLIIDDGNQGQTPSSTIIPINEWTHVAAVRSGLTTTCYINGISASINSFIPLTNNSITIAKYPNDNIIFNGYISNLRIVKGQALYSSNFSPSIKNLTVTSTVNNVVLSAENVSLLTFQNSEFKDNSGNTLNLTINGNPRMERYSPPSSGRITLKATASLISDNFNYDNLKRINDISKKATDDNINNPKIDISAFQKFLPINGSKPMAGDLFMDACTVSKYSAKILTYTDDFTLTQEFNSSIILIEKPNPTGNVNNKIKVTINPNTLNVGFNAILIQTDNTQVEIYGLGIVKILNPDGFLYTRSKYSVINLCVLKPNYVWAFGDMTGIGSTIPNILPPTTPPITTSTVISGTGYLIASDNSLYDPVDIEYERYTTTNFEINALFRKNEFTDPQIKEMKAALDYWSLVLKDTVLPVQQQPSFSYDGERYFPNNPVFNTISNDGYILYVSSLTGDPNLLGAASYYYTRNAETDKNTNHYRLPSIGFFYINKNNIPNMMNNVTPMGRTTLYYTFLHEICHALGFGTLWHKINNNVLERSFVVGANDFSNNTYLNLSGNIFYTINRGDNINFRKNTDFYKGSNPILVNMGDAESSKFAYNPNSIVNNISLAVSAYNACFQTSLTAIPLENTMAWNDTTKTWQIGSYGAHWAEGDSPEARDARQYYGKVSPGAPTLSDELMTPIVEDSRMDMPTSKITLGALSDLGWTVNMNAADNFDPYVIAVKFLDAAKTKIGYRKFNFGGYYDASSMTMTHLRKSNTYTIINETDQKVYVYKIDNTILETINPNSTGTVTIPLNYAETGLYIAPAGLGVYPWAVI